MDFSLTTNFDSGRRKYFAIRIRTVPSLSSHLFLEKHRGEKKDKVYDIIFHF